MYFLVKFLFNREIKDWLINISCLFQIRYVAVNMNFLFLLSPYRYGKGERKFNENISDSKSNFLFTMYTAMANRMGNLVYEF